MVYTLEEKYQIVVWHHNGISERQIQNHFQNMFQNRPIPSRKTIRRIMNNLRTHGTLSVSQLRRERRIRPLNPDRELRDIMICASIEENPLQSTTHLAEEFGISHVSIGKILRKNGYHPYKLQKTNEIFPEDLYRRMVFCESVIEMSNRDENFIQNILFTDESSFLLHGRHNSAIRRCWATENPHRVYNARTQYPGKLNVWAGILGDHIVGPFFIDGTLTGAKYLELLRNEIIPAVRNLPVPFESVWFQQDGCPAHNSRQVREYLNNTFPDRIISGRGNILWPARSPDLTPCDFFCGGILNPCCTDFKSTELILLMN